MSAGSSPPRAAAKLDRCVVAFGGGHGLHNSLASLRHVVSDLTGVVTVADNGGSSGRLRGEFGVLPPGDLRMALAALCGDDDWGRTWARVMQHRFDSDGDMQGHVVGNLLIVALWELLGGHVNGLDWVGRLLDAEGRVLPMAVTPMDITAEVTGLDRSDPERVDTVRGQVAVALTPGTVTSISLDPPDPVACPEAVRAVREADWIVLGPGSWYTSVIPHLMVPALRRAIVESPGRVLVVLNLEEQAGETGGYGPMELMQALLEHARDLEVHTVLADPRSVPDVAGLHRVVTDAGGVLALEDVSVPGTAQHDSTKLAAAYARIMGDV